MTEPFIIRCETCAARLRVRSAAAVGSILACPKCQSLVNVTLPEEAAKDPSPAASPATEAGPTDQSGAVEPATSLFALKLAAAAASIAIIVGAAIVLGLGPSSEAESEIAAGETRSVAANSRQPDIEDEDIEDGTTASDPVGVEPGQEVTPSGPSRLSGDTDAPQLRDDASSTETHGAADASARPPALPEPVPEATTDGSNPRAAAARQREIPPIGIPQLDFGFSSDEETIVNERRDPVRQPEEAAPAEVAREHSQPPDEAPPSSIPRMTIALVSADAGAPSNPSTDPMKALAMPLANFIAEDRPLVELIRLVADLSGTTITITPEAYRSLQSKESSQLSFQKVDTTAGELLTAMLERYSLGVESPRGQLLVRPANRTGGAAPSSPSGARPPETLDQFVTFTFTTPTPLADVLRHIERASGSTLLVDWPSLAERNLRPSSLITATAVDQPFGDVLDVLLPQLDLDWSPIDKSAIWITAR